MLLGIFPNGIVTEIHSCYFLPTNLIDIHILLRLFYSIIQRNFGASLTHLGALRCHMSDAHEEHIPVGTVFPNFGLFVKLNCTRIIDVRARWTSQIQYWKRIPFVWSSRCQLKSKYSTESIERLLTNQRSLPYDRSLSSEQATHRQMADRHHSGRKAEPPESSTFIRLT